MTDWVVNTINELGYLGLAVMMLIECIFPLMPSEAVLPFAGFVVAQGDMTFVLAVTAATLGGLVGNLILYGAARWGGTPLVERYGPKVGATPPRMERFQSWMDRWGTLTVLVSRTIPLARTNISIPAGLAHFPIGRFILLTTLGSAVWNSLLIGMGWALNDAWREVEHTLGPISIAFVATVVVAFAAWLVVRRVRSRRLSTPE